MCVLRSMRLCQHSCLQGWRLRDDTFPGEMVEATLNQLHFRKSVGYPNESQRSSAEDMDGFWAEYFSKQQEKGKN